jgi:hypothetical protein
LDGGDTSDEFFEGQGFNPNQSHDSGRERKDIDDPPTGNLPAITSRQKKTFILGVHAIGMPMNYLMLENSKYEHQSSYKLRNSVVTHVIEQC